MWMGRRTLNCNRWDFQCLCVSLSLSFVVSMTPLYRHVNNSTQSLGDPVLSGWPHSTHHRPQGWHRSRLWQVALSSKRFCRIDSKNDSLKTSSSLFPYCQSSFDGGRLHRGVWPSQHLAARQWNTVRYMGWQASLTNILFRFSRFATNRWYPAGSWVIFRLHLHKVGS